MAKRPVKKASEPKDPEAKVVIARQALRYRILRLIYDLAEGSTDRPVDAYDINVTEKLSYSSLEQLISYLRDEKLIQAPEYSVSRVFLKHKGLVELEKAILDPAAGTDHFSATVTMAYARNSAGHTKGMRLTATSDDLVE